MGNRGPTYNFRRCAFFTVVGHLFALFLGFRRIVFDDQGPGALGAIYSPSFPIFNTSGLQTFMHMLQIARRRRDKELVLLCPVRSLSCGGIADRVKGAPFAVMLALGSRRQFQVHSSLLTNVGIRDFDKGKHYEFVDDRCHSQPLLYSLMTDESPIVYVTSNCDWPAVDILLSIADLEHRDLLQTAAQECSVVTPCGAAVIHSSEVFRDDLLLVHQFVSGLFMLPFREYTALHIRTGGSRIKVEGTSVPAVAWYDGHASSIPQKWLDLFRTTAFENCSKPLAFISDSVRMVSELRSLCSDKLSIFSCCNQPLHRDRVFKEGFFYQEVIDLYIMARSRRVIIGAGGFGLLGRYWLGLDGPSLTIAHTEEETRKAMNMLLSESLCTFQNETDVG
jgi:hypothetical protein